MQARFRPGAIRVMTMQEQPTRRVLIASNHALFGQGLRRLLQERREAGVEVVGMVSSVDEALAALEQLHPDLIVVDYDDKSLNREEFLARFVEGETKLRVVLLSLQSPQEAIVYDRRTLAASQIDNWLEEWNYSDEVQKSPIQQGDKYPKVENRRRSVMKKYIHMVVAAVLVVVVAAGLIYLLENGGTAALLPVAASAQAEPIDSLFGLELKVIAFLFSLIVVLMLYSIVVFRRKKGDLEDAEHIEGNTKLEITWTAIPLATVLFFAFLGGQSLADTLRADPQPEIISVIGQKWQWSFEYPVESVAVDKVASAVMYMPVDKQSILYLSSRDIIHSFWVPEFRVKQDALPGGEDFVRTLRVTPTQEGTYYLRCAELCGEQHTNMIAEVRVVSQAEFDAWVTGEVAKLSDPVAIGQNVYENNCKACHSIDGSDGVGPTWLGLLGEQVELTDGTTFTSDEAYILESITNPNAKIVAGFPAGVMPQNYAEVLTEEQINGLIEYIRTLVR
jgi:cytochrome c oxidase subunit 2